jgi:hypothetical protein
MEQDRPSSPQPPNTRPHNHQAAFIPRICFPARQTKPIHLLPPEIFCHLEPGNHRSAVLLAMALDEFL